MTRPVRGARRRARLLAAMTIGLASVGVGLSSTPAPATTTQAASFSGLGCVTSSTTNTSSWGSATAPSNAVFAEFTIIGGGGAAGDNNAGGGGAGGAGGIVTGRVAVTPGQVLWARIGCGGTDADSHGDWNGRRAAGWARGGGAEDFGGGGGGGATGLCIGTAAGGCASGTMVAIAGGGGGGAKGSGTSTCSDQSGGSGGNANAGSGASAHSGSARGGGRGTNGSGSTPRGDGGGGGGGGGQGPGQNTGATTADNTGGAAGGDVSGATNGGSMGGTPAPDPGEGGAGGRGANGRNNITGGGGGGGYTGGGGGAGGEDGSCVWGNWNGGGGGGAGASWVRNTVSSVGFSTVSGTFSTCNDTLGANAGKGANFGSGSRGCHGNVSVTWIRNAPPTGSTASYTVNRNAAFPFTLQAADSDGDTPVTCQIVTPPTKGTLGGSGCGRSYTAGSTATGTDQLTYRVVDSQGVASPSYIVTFTIQNREPVGGELTVSATKGTPTTITLPASDPDGDALTCATSDGPYQGTLSSTGCTRTYTAPADTFGLDELWYTVSDGQTSAGPYLVTINIVNRAPASADRDVFTGPGQQVPIDLVGTDPDGDTTTCLPTTEPALGYLSGAPDCAMSYEAPYELGVYTFTYVSSDGDLNSVERTVTIYVQSPDVAIAKSHVGVFDDGEQGTYTITVSNEGNAPTGGTITVVDDLPAGMTLASAAMGTSGFTCPATAGATQVTCTRASALPASTSVSFTITVDVADGAESGTNVATVSAVPDHVEENNTAEDPTTVNLRPTADAIEVETVVDVPVAITLTGSDPEGGELTFQAGLPSSGTLGGTAPDLTFTPAAGAANDVTFTYTVSDPEGHTSYVATVTITVVAPGIAGVVSADDTGEGIGGITVRLYEDGVGFTPYAATTAEDGSYYLGATVPEGEYRVIFKDPLQDYVDEWHLDSLTRSGSTPVTVSSTEESTIDAGLATGAEIDVTIANDGPFTVALYNAAPTGASAHRSVSGVTGSTAIRGLPAGTYYVSVTDPAGRLVPKWSGNQTAREGAVGIPLAAGGTATSAFTLVNRNTIQGTVEDVNGPISGVTVQAYGATSGAFVKSAKSDAIGEYVLRDLAPGDYKLVFRDISGVHPVMWSGGAEVIGSASTVTLGAGSSVTFDSDLPVLASVGGTVTGGPDGTTPLAGAKVTLYRNGAALRTYTTTAAGTYAAPGLAPGSYTALFSAPGHRAEYNLDRARRADADAVVVGEGASVTIDAALSPA
jgi:uncharacterized repeat protein (TIGR01451 family)